MGIETLHGFENDGLVVVIHQSYLALVALVMLGDLVGRHPLMVVHLGRLVGYKLQVVGLAARHLLTVAYPGHLVGKPLLLVEGHQLEAG